MANWDQVRKIALELPETRETTSHGNLTWCVRDKSFAWVRPLRAADLEALGVGGPKGEILGVRVAHLLAKEARLAAQPECCFTTPHFDGYAAVLVQLGKIKVADLRELLVEGWLARAPKRLAQDFSPRDSRLETRAMRSKSRSR